MVAVLAVAAVAVVAVAVAVVAVIVVVLLSVVAVAVMVISHLFQQQQLFMKPLGVTVIFNGDPQPLLYNRTNDR